MKALRLRRLLTANGACVGVLSGLSRTLYTLEDEWRDNRRGVSCIPAGTYRVTPHGWAANTPLTFKQVWQVLNVPSRIGILFHAGNKHAETEGCILAGLTLLVTQLVSSVGDSRMAIDLMRREIGENEFTLTIE